MAETARLGALLIVHAEDAELIAAAPAPGGPSYATYLRSRPAAAEERAIERILAAAARIGPARPRVHVLHLSSAGALAQLRAARADGVDVSVETCPHYLAIVAEAIDDGATQFKCAPPIRDADNCERLWDGAGRRRDRHDRVRSLPVHRGPQAPGHRRLRCGVGRDRVAGARPPGRVDRGPRPGPRPRRRGALDGDRSRRSRRADLQGPDRGRRRRRPRRVRPGGGVRRRSIAAAASATRCPPMPGAGWPAWSARPGCGASESTRRAPPATAD